MALSLNIRLLCGVAVEDPVLCGIRFVYVFQSEPTPASYQVITYPPDPKALISFAGPLPFPLVQ